jgi:hypothetical protein
MTIALNSAETITESTERAEKRSRLFTILNAVGATTVFVAIGSYVASNINVMSADRPLLHDTLLTVAAASSLSAMVCAMSCNYLEDRQTAHQQRLDERLDQLEVHFTE